MNTEIIVTVVSAASSYALTTLAVVKEELGITDNLTDALLTRWIAESSEVIAGYTERVWGLETVTQLIRRAHPLFHAGGYDHFEGTGNVLRLARWPVTAIASIVEDDTDTLTEGADYEVDYRSGMVYRLFSGQAFPWRRRKTLVSFSGGYALPDAAPLRLQQACLALIKGRWSNRTRDPSLRSFNIPGVIEKTFWTPQAGQSDLPPEVVGLLDGLCERSF